MLGASQGGQRGSAPHLAEARRRQDSIALFLVLTFSFSLPFFSRIVSRATWQGAFIDALYGWAPALAAMATRFVFQRNVRGLGWRRGKWRYIIAAFFIPIGYSAFVCGPLWRMGYFDPDMEPVHWLTSRLALIGIHPGAESSFLLWMVYQGGLGAIAICAMFLGQELGWRGFLVAELDRGASFTQTALLSWAAWALWSLPCMVIISYHPDIPRWRGLACYAVILLGMSFPLAWFRLKSGSVWPSTLFCAAHYTWVRFIFGPSTRWTSLTRLLVSDFGVVMAAMCAFVGFFFWLLNDWQPATPPRS